MRAVASHEIDIGVLWGPQAVFHGRRQATPLDYARARAALIEQLVGAARAFLRIRFGNADGRPAFGLQRPDVQPAVEPVHGRGVVERLVVEPGVAGGVAPAGRRVHAGAGTSGNVVAAGKDRREEPETALPLHPADQAVPLRVGDAIEALTKKTSGRVLIGAFALVILIGCGLGVYHLLRARKEGSV